MLHQRSRFSSLSVLSAIFSLSSLMLISEGTEHIVGDSTGWELFTNYTNWTEGKEFHVGDVLGNFLTPGFLNSAKSKLNPIYNLSPTTKMNSVNSVSLLQQPSVPYQW